MIIILVLNAGNCSKKITCAALIEMSVMDCDTFGYFKFTTNWGNQITKMICLRRSVRPEFLFINYNYLIGDKGLDTRNPVGLTLTL